MRVEFGFTPRWFHERCGIDFSERYHLDPLYRRECLVAMRHELNRCFPSLGLGGDRPDDSVANLDSVQGALLVSKIFGVGSEYFIDNWPAARHEFLSKEQVAALEVPNLPDVPVFAQVFEQMDTIERAFGRIEGYLNWQGVLNNAFRIRGQDVFADLIEDPPLVHHLFEVIARTMIEGARQVYARQRESGVTVRHFTVSNCVVNMVSPDAYREHLMPYDKMISDAFEHFGIHNCAWNVDPYIADYAQIRTLGYVDMGLDSNLARCRRLCPDTRRALMYSPVELVTKPLKEIRDDLARVRRELSPCDIVMADIDHGTPDERVIAFAEMAASSLNVQPEA